MLFGLELVFWGGVDGIIRSTIKIGERWGGFELMGVYHESAWIFSYFVGFGGWLAWCDRV